ncbi:MAG: hypothetical protein P8Y12_04395, partial [Gammaproteobacteria bacterium]
MTTQSQADPQEGFDPYKKELELRAESYSWDTSSPEQAKEGDIPVIDLSDFCTTGSGDSLNRT